MLSDGDVQINDSIDGIDDLNLKDLKHLEDRGPTDR